MTGLSPAYSAILAGVCGMWHRFFVAVIRRTGNLFPRRICDQNFDRDRLVFQSRLRSYGPGAEVGSTPSHDPSARFTIRDLSVGISVDMDIEVRSNHGECGAVCGLEVRELGLGKDESIATSVCREHG